MQTELQALIETNRTLMRLAQTDGSSPFDVDAFRLGMASKDSLLSDLDKRISEIPAFPQSNHSHVVALYDELLAQEHELQDMLRTMKKNILQDIQEIHARKSSTKRYTTNRSHEQNAHIFDIHSGE
jgi:hypothetical protein